MRMKTAASGWAPLLLAACCTIVAGCASSGRTDVAIAAGPAAAGADDVADAGAVFEAAAKRFDDGDLDGAAEGMTGFIAYWPELLVHVPTDMLYALAFRGDPFTPDRIGYMQALFDANWDGDDGPAGAVWTQLATARLLEGDREAARVALRRVDDPGSMVVLRGDRRFDGLYDPRDWQDRVARAARRQVDRLQLMAASREDPLPARVQLGYALMALGEFEAVLALADEALTDAGVVPGADVAPSRDALWMLNLRADAMVARGRFDDAVEVLRTASAAGEDGSPNIDQRLNLADLLCRLGRDAEAAAALDIGDDDITDLGRAFRAHGRQCVALVRGDGAAALAALDEVEALAADARLLHMLALVAVDRGDDAVAVAKTMLDAPAERAHLVHWAQGFRELPPLPGEIAARARVDAFRDRADFRAAVDAVARIETYSLYRGTR